MDYYNGLLSWIIIMDYYNGLSWIILDYYGLWWIIMGCNGLLWILILDYNSGF